MVIDAMATEYWHFILVFGVLGGLGTSLLSTVAVGAIGHFFKVRRGFATGIASCAGSLGGIIFTLIFSKISSTAGFAWATRTLGFIFSFLLILANLLVRSRLPRKPITKGNLLPDVMIFKDKTFLIMTIALFLIEWGLFTSLSYTTSFALAAGIRPEFAYQVIPILNAGSFFGRWAPGLLADKIGRFNTMILMIALCMITTLALWLPAAFSTSLQLTKGLLIAFALLFGFASGSNISLGPVCAGQLCVTENYGKYFATCFTVVGVGTLVGIPIGGEILAQSGGNYEGLIIFGAGCYAVGLIFFMWARICAVGWGLKKENIF